jgi:hypothetical protein
LIKFVPIRLTPRYCAGAVALAVTILALGRIHLRLRTILIGYDIGRVKKEEIELREKNSELRMLLAKVSSFKHLNLMIQTKDDEASASAQVALK